MWTKYILVTTLQTKNGNLVKPWNLAMIKFCLCLTYMFINYTFSGNRKAEEQFVKERDQTNPGSEWERVSKLCDFNPKVAKGNKDVSRMRSSLLHLKQNPRPVSVPEENANWPRFLTNNQYYSLVREFFTEIASDAVTHSNLTMIFSKLCFFNIHTYMFFSVK